MSLFSHSFDLIPADNHLQYIHSLQLSPERGQNPLEATAMDHKDQNNSGSPKSPHLLFPTVPTPKLWQVCKAHHHLGGLWLQNWVHHGHHLDLQNFMSVKGATAMWIALLLQHEIASPVTHANKNGRKENRSSKRVCTARLSCGSGPQEIRSTRNFDPRCATSRPQTGFLM